MRVLTGEEVSPIVESVEIVIEDVFAGHASQSDFWGYRLANQVHIRTREHVVRQELLFSEGDPVTEEALAQTERNLRALPFLREARVETTPTSDGRVRVKVTVADSWTTLPVFRVAKVAEEWLWSAGGAERNLFGYGKELRVFRHGDLDREQTYFSFRDPRLRGSRIATGMLFSEASDGHQAVLSASRPFYSLDASWGFRVQLEDYDRLDPLYQDGERVEDLRHERRRKEIDLARAVLRTGSSAVRLHAGYDFSEDVLNRGETRRRFGIARFGISTVQHRFVKLTHVNRFERPEDVNLGLESSFFFGRSTSALGGEPDPSWFFWLSSSRGLRYRDNGFLFVRGSWQARHRNARWENGLLRTRVGAVQKLSETKVLLAKAELAYGRALDPEVQVRLGAESGLRGYPVRQFNGSRSLLLSAEARWFFADDIAELVSLGLSAFVDSGYAWPDGLPIALADLRSNVGLSLLIGPSRAAARRPGVRIDLGYALDPIAGQSRWVLSAGSQLQF